MKLDEMVLELAAEVATILDPDFSIDVTQTQTVPHSSDVGITFPNLDAKRQGTKLLTSCVLYIDIRRSTELNLSHKPATVAKLYSAFVRAMTKCARHFNGHVRGIIGDRVMVVFDADHAFENAVDCAILMNSAAKYVINKHFRAGEVRCGIGIDAGNMLVTKTGVRRHGVEQAAYRNLVWLGRPANVASKLTDVANKPGRTAVVPAVQVGVAPDVMGHWAWHTETAAEFVSKLQGRATGPFMDYPTPHVRSFIPTTETVVVEPNTPEILMTAAVWAGFKAARPEAQEIRNGWIQSIEGLTIAGYTGKIYGGNVHFLAFNPAGG